MGARAEVGTGARMGIADAKGTAFGLENELEEGSPAKRGTAFDACILSFCRLHI